MSDREPTIPTPDRYMPNQPYLRSLYRGTEFERDLFRDICHWSRLPATSPYAYSDAPQFTQEEMGSDPITQRFIEFLLTISRAKRVLEIGTFIGLTSMMMADAIGPDGTVVTIEKFAEHAETARKNVARNRMERRVAVIEGDALVIAETLPRDQLFDFIFLDAYKEKYLELFQKLEPLLAPEGIFLVDDSWFMADALNRTPSTPKGAGARAFLEYAARRDDLIGTLLPIRSGIYAVTRKRRR